MTSAAEPQSSRCDTRDAVRVGAVIGDSYRIVGSLGSGGMGEVYEAEHLRLGATVALKLLRAPADEDSARRLLREARLTAGLGTDHVVRVNDCGSLPDGSPYVVMERLRGEDLRHLLKREAQLSVQRSLRIALQICAGLVDLHAVGIVHRDLKPANVFVLQSEPGVCRCKLLDLGIARSLNNDTSRSITVAGSVRYMAPEQLADAKAVAAYTDVYAAGVILYQCLTGVLPHQGETVEEIMFSIMQRRPRAVSELCPEVAPSLSALVMSAIDRDNALRPQTASAFARELSGFIVSASPERPVVAAADATLPELPLQRAFGAVGPRSRRLGWTAAVITLVATVLVLKLGGRSAPSTTTAPVAAHSVAPVASVAQPSALSLREAPTSERPALAVTTPAPTPAARIADAAPRAHPAPVRPSAPPHSAPLQSAAETDQGLEKNPYAH